MKEQATDQGVNSLDHNKVMVVCRPIPGQQWQWVFFLNVLEDFLNV